jgi:hypothetical protein
MRQRARVRWWLLQNHGDGNRSYGKGNDEAQHKDRVIPVCAATGIDHAALGILAHAMLWFDMAGMRKPTE